MSNELEYDNDRYDYGVDATRDYTGKRSKPRSTSNNAPHGGRKRGKTPVSVNGIHRRRRRKMAW